MLASKSRGYQAKGTVIVRPSTRSTASVAKVTCTSRTRSPGLGWKVFTPFLQQRIAILHDQPMDSKELCRAEAEVPRQRYRVQPEFCGLIISIHMDVGSFVRLMAVKIHTIRTHQ